MKNLKKYVKRVDVESIKGIGALVKLGQDLKPYGFQMTQYTYLQGYANVNGEALRAELLDFITKKDSYKVFITREVEYTNDEYEELYASTNTMEDAINVILKADDYDYSRLEIRYDFNYNNECLRYRRLDAYKVLKVLANKVKVKDIIEELED